MAGPQFAHIETYARKPNKHGNSVDQVLAELEREAEFSVHVEHPEPPRHIDGVSIADLRRRHDEMIEAAKTTVIVRGVERQRAIRQDRPTLMTMVASFPMSWAELDGDPDGAERLREWREANVAHAKALFGDAYMCTLEHTDEAYPHLHIYALPEDAEDAHANHLHPGHVAKDAAERAAKEGGADKSAALKAGNAAYRAAMRAWQDDYFRAVGEPSGLMRDGPRRKRLTRAEYLAEKSRADERRLSVQERRLQKLDDRHAAQTAREGDVAAAISELDVRAASQDARDAALSDREAAVAKNEDDIATRRAQLSLDEWTFKQDRAEFLEEVASISRRRDSLEAALNIVQDATAWIAETLKIDLPDRLSAGLKRIATWISVDRKRETELQKSADHPEDDGFSSPGL